MEVDEIRTQACKFPAGDGEKKLAHVRQAQDTNMGSGGESHNLNHLRGWHHSSRIIRVSRASGGKDRHSKVMTSKGLRDRRVRLSVGTAIQFYDLQDRLGYDQPSKAVEWLIKAAEDAIAELPSLNAPFPETPKQSNDSARAGNEKDERTVDTAKANLENQNMSLSKSACSSTSETSKNSGLFLSWTEVRGKRVNGGEGGRDRMAKEKETGADVAYSRHNVASSISQSQSFTQLLTAGFNSVTTSNNNNNISNNNEDTSPSESAHQSPNRHCDPVPLGYFSLAHQGISSQIHLGSSLPQAIPVPAFSISNENHGHQEFSSHQFSVFPDNMIQAASQLGGSGDYGPNFSTSSGCLTSISNRGTLQSNSPALLNHLQRFSSSPVHGTSVPILFSTPFLQNHQHHHQFQTGFDGRLQLHYDDGVRHPGEKGKGRS